MSNCQTKIKRNYVLHEKITWYCWRAFYFSKIPKASLYVLVEILITIEICQVIYELPTKLLALPEESFKSGGCTQYLNKK